MKSSLLLYLITVCFSAHAQMNWVKQWDHRYGGLQGDYVIAFVQTNDKCFLLAGKTASDSSGNKMTHMIGNGAFDYWIIKVDTGGNLLWEKDFQATGTDALWSLNKTSDGGFIIGGTSDSPVGGDKSEASRGGDDYWVLRLDGNGNKIWDKTFGGSDDEDLRYIMQTADGGFLIGGDSRSGISGDKTEAKFGVNDYWVIKTDSLGVKQWDKVYGGTGYEQYRQSVQTPDGGFVHAGQSNSGVGGNKTDVSQGGLDYWLVKTDSLGTIQWDSAYGGSGDDNLQTIIRISGGGFMCGGWSTSGASGDKTQPSNGAYDFWILKLSQSGTIVWDKDFGGTGIEDEFNTIYPTTDGGYLLGGTSYSGAGADKTDNNLGVEQPWIIKIDAVGNKLWDKTVFTLGHLEAGLIVEIDEKCYVVVSADNSTIGGDKSEDAWGGFSSDYWIVKYCQGTSTSSDNLMSAENDLSVYPNPFSDEIFVNLNSDQSGLISTVIVSDALGKIAFMQKFNNQLRISTSSFSKGVYTLEIICNGKSARRKVIK